MEIFLVSTEHLSFLEVGEIEEVRRPVGHVIEGERSRQSQFVAHVRVIPDPHEVVVPRACGRHHEVAQEAVAQQHLHLQRKAH